jgi:hypothetical protein
MDESKSVRKSSLSSYSSLDIFGQFNTDLSFQSKQNAIDAIRASARFNWPATASLNRIKRNLSASQKDSGFNVSKSRI